MVPSASSWWMMWRSGVRSSGACRAGLVVVLGEAWGAPRVGFRCDKQQLRNRGGFNVCEWRVYLG